MTVSVPRFVSSPERRRSPAVRIGTRSSFLLLLTTLFGIAAFAWPLMIHQSSGPNSRGQRRRALDFRRPCATPVGDCHGRALRRGHRCQGGGVARDPRRVFCRTAGAQSRYQRLRARMVPSHPHRPRVLGRGFGFVLGAVAFFASALITGGVGPWLPFQMLAAAWVGFGAGCLPLMRGDPERLLLAGYGVVSALVYGMLTIFWFWPFVGGSTTTYSFVPGLGTIENLHRFILFDLTTSMGFDLTRAATCAVMVLVLGRPVLAALRRASRRAVFEPQIQFIDRAGGETTVDWHGRGDAR